MAMAVAVNALVVEPSSKRVSAVTDAEWQKFLAEEITARFPSGLTTWEASGQWRDEHNVIERERTHIVQVVHPASGDVEGRITAIIALYKKRFAQEAVFRVRSD